MLIPSIVMVADWECGVCKKATSAPATQDSADLFPPPASAVTEVLPTTPPSADLKPEPDMKEFVPVAETDVTADSKVAMSNGKSSIKRKW